MLRYRAGSVGGFSAHCVSAWWSRAACLPTMQSTHTVRGMSTSSEGAMHTGKWEPQLRRLAVVRPDLVDEWVPELNDADVGSVPCTSQISVWWRCAACGENYQATVRDRAVVDKGCPRCSAVQQQQSHGSDSNKVMGETTADSGNGGAPSLADTHPQIASRWDQEKNGLLRPTDVTSTSDLNVWWRPAEGRPAHERSFRRPVYAFVEVPYSMEEQKEAQAKMEIDILQQIRQAAKIAEAREREKFPAAATMLDDIISNNNNSPNGAASVLGTHESQSQELQGEDLHKAIELWERGLEAKAGGGDRPLFQFTESCDWAAVSREQVLNTYNEFVLGHKQQKQANEDNNVDQNSSSVKKSAVPSVIADSDWVQHFTLSVDDVSKDWFSSSARLVLSDTASISKQPQSAEEEGKEAKTEGKRDDSTGRRRRIDTLPPPPEEYENDIRTVFASRKRSYPRRPQMPPSREDDIAESVPKATTTHQSSAAFRGDAGKDGHMSLSKELPSAASFEVLGLAGTQSLVREYAFSSDKDVQFDADETELQQQSLLGQSALQSMSSAEAQSLQYNRGTPRPRRTGRFRLRAPDEADVRKGMKLGSALGTSTAEAAEGAQPQTIQAPGAPRKVARPKKRRQETADTDNSAEETATSQASA